MAAAAAAECEWAGKSEGVAVVGKSGSGRTSQGSAQPQLIYIPSRRKVGRGWMGGGRGVSRNACGGEEKPYFTAAEQ